MRRLYAPIVMLLSLALAGGAQACVALCNPAARESTPLPVKRGCGGCAGKKQEQPKPAEKQKPCAKCVSGQEQTASPKAPSIDPPLATGEVVPAVETAATLSNPSGVAQVFCHSPPGERLHLFCLLLN